VDCGARHSPTLGYGLLLEVEESHERTELGGTETGIDGIRPEGWGCRHDRPLHAGERDFEVEFVRTDGYTQALLTLSIDQIQPLEQPGILHVRSLDNQAAVSQDSF